MSNIYNIDTAASYATEDNLLKAIKKKLGDNVRFMVVRNRAGRYTAIFSASMNNHIMPIHIANAGFKVFN